MSSPGLLQFPFTATKKKKLNQLLLLELTLFFVFVQGICLIHLIFLVYIFYIPIYPLA